MRTWVPTSAPSLLPAPTTEPFGLGAALAVPTAALVAPSTIPSSSWLEQQQLAEELNEGRWGKSVTSKRVLVPHGPQRLARYPTHLLTYWFTCPLAYSSTEVAVEEEISEDLSEELRARNSAKRPG